MQKVQKSTDLDKIDVVELIRDFTKSIKINSFASYLREVWRVKNY